MLEFSVIRKTFFPLRSSAGWFESQATVAALERHIKLSLICFDELIFQDGEFLLNISDTGSLWFFTPPGLKPNEYRKLTFGKGKDFSLQLAPEGSTEHVSVISGPAITSYQVDFYPILKDAGILGQEYIKGLTDDFANDVKQHFDTQINDDKSNVQITQSLSPLFLEKDDIIESYYIDSYAAHQLGASINFDSRVGSFIVAKNDQIVSQYIPDVSSLVFDKALYLEIPDFRELSWEQIHEIRQSSAGQSFRDMIQRIQSSVAEEFANIHTIEELNEIIYKNFTREHHDEMKDFLPNGETTTIGWLFSLASLFFSPLGFTGNIVETLNLIKKSQSWVSLLKR